MAPEWSGASFIASTGWLRWSKTSVGALIENPYGLKLPVRTMGEYLKRWGFTPQKPLRKAFEQKPKMVRAWLAETYPLIAAGAKAERAEIFWGDRTGVNNQPNRSRGYAPRGQTPVVSQTSKRFGFSVMSAVTNKGGARWMVYPGALDSDRLIEFLTRLIKQAGGSKGLSDPRQPARASQGSGENLAGAAYQGNRHGPSAQLQSRVESRKARLRDCGVDAGLRPGTQPRRVPVDTARNTKSPTARHPRMGTGSARPPPPCAGCAAAPGSSALAGTSRTLPLTSVYCASVNRRQFLHHEMDGGKAFDETILCRVSLNGEPPEVRPVGKERRDIMGRNAVNRIPIALEWK